MSKLIRKDEANNAAVYSRDLREYVVPVRVLNKLKTFEEPTEQEVDYKDALRTMFNRCAVQMSCNGAMCIFCGHRDICNDLRDVHKPKTN